MNSRKNRKKVIDDLVIKIKAFADSKKSTSEHKVDPNVFGPPGTSPFTDVREENARWKQMSVDMEKAHEMINDSKQDYRDALDQIDHFLKQATTHEYWGAGDLSYTEIQEEFEQLKKAVAEELLTNKKTLS